MTQAILAGFLIGIGDIVLMKSSNPYVGALLFAVALMTIIYCQIPLFTGRVGYIYKDKNWSGLFLGLLFNVVGATLAVWLFTLMSPENAQLVKEVTNAKLVDKNYLTLFIAGILCNVLIHLAVYSQHTIIVILCVATFIISGFEHSIADAPYAFLSFDFEIVFSWLFVLAGNAVGGIATEWMLTFATNVGTTNAEPTNTEATNNGEETSAYDADIDHLGSDSGIDNTDYSKDVAIDAEYTQINEGEN